MNLLVRIPLNTSPEQFVRLQALQVAFARVCNALAPVVRQTRIWNRVALHHLAYKDLRERFPELGSQMVCNAIYSVSRTSRMVYQNPGSPFNLSRLGDKPLPLLHFADSCPVYFDRHTLSLKPGRLSLYTLDGRMHFDLSIDPQVEVGFREKAVREIVLSGAGQSAYCLTFSLSGQVDADDAAGVEAKHVVAAELPEYVMVETVE